MVHTYQPGFPTWIPNCPSSLGEHWVSCSAVSGIEALLALVFAILISVLFNSITVGNRKARPPGISNVMWIGYFSVTCVR